MDIFPVQFLYAPGALSRCGKGGAVPAFKAATDHVINGNACAHNAAAQLAARTSARAAVTTHVRS